jgi:hypothetical protein
MLGKIIYHERNRLVIDFEEEINPEFLKLLARDKDNLAEVKLIDNEPKSAKQNALSHALIKDIAKHQELPLHEAKQLMKALYKEGYEIEFSHAGASMTEMNAWLEFLIEHVLSEGIALPRRYSYLLEYEKFFYFCCKYRKCCVCGKPHAQIHHVKAVGKRKRNKVDHRLFPFASLCWIHHNVAHAIGEIRLLKEFLITPVYLDKEALIKIGIMSNNQILTFDQEYHDEELFQKAIGG